MANARDKALVYHRGNWLWIKNPFNGEEESPDVIDRRQSALYYKRKWWKLGPTYLYPNYTGIVISTYAYVGTQNIPAFLIWIHSVGMSTKLYAQDLPDLLEVLSLLAPLVFTGILADAYQRN